LKASLLEEKKERRWNIVDIEIKLMRDESCG